VQGLTRGQGGRQAAAAGGGAILGSQPRAEQGLWGEGGMAV
jgi:hypothetical protein